MGAAATFALFAHLAILSLFLYETPRISPQEGESRSISLDIVEPMPAQNLASPPPRAAHAPRTLAAPRAAEPRQPDEPSAPQGAPAPASTRAPSTTSDVTGATALGKALRGSMLGCNHADIANLTDEERQHCRDKFAANRADGPDLSQFAISPEKRAMYDAAWKADHSPQHMAGVICLARFGGGKLEWLHPSEGVKLGPLPCYVYTPKATFSADPPHARGWR